MVVAVQRRLTTVMAIGCEHSRLAAANTGHSNSLAVTPYWQPGGDEFE
ncbi:MAG: hypothetical protein ABR564_02825 [Candidatus Dormibacteria bacterium]